MAKQPCRFHGRESDLEVDQRQGGVIKSPILLDSVLRQRQPICLKLLKTENLKIFRVLLGPTLLKAKAGMKFIENFSLIFIHDASIHCVRFTFIREKTIHCTRLTFQKDKPSHNDPPPTGSDCPSTSTQSDEGKLNYLGNV